MQNDIDDILAKEHTITPSPEFLGSVMEAVEREAAAPQPLAFPWIRALPGILAIITALVVATWNGIGALRDPAAIAAFAERLDQLTAAAMGIGLHWVVLSVAMTALSLMLASSLMRPRHFVLA